MSKLVNEILQKYKTFTDSQKKIADYLVENLDRTAFITLEDISSEVGVSTATVIRFARTLGYSGYTELQKDLQNIIKSKVALPYRLDKPTEIPQDKLLYDSFENDIKNVQLTLSHLDKDVLQDTIQLINSAKSVYILGMRGAFTLAYYMFSRLGQIKRNVHLVQSVGESEPEELISITKDDVCIAYFFQRIPKKIAILLSWLKQKGIKIILFTDINNNYAKDFGTKFLPCAVSGISFKKSYVAPLCLTNYLIAAIVGTDYDNSKKMLEEMEELLSLGYHFML